MRSWGRRSALCGAPPTDGHRASGDLSIASAAASIAHPAWVGFALRNCGLGLLLGRLHYGAPLLASGVHLVPGLARGRRRGGHRWAQFAMDGWIEKEETSCFAF